jgi:hypothetical protein
MASSSLDERKLGWLRGPLRSAVVEITVTAVFSALVVVTRAFKVPILPPIVVADLAGAFSYTPSSLISFPYCLVFVALNTMTAPNPFLAFFPWVVSIPLVNLTSKIAGQYAMWTPLLGPYTGISIFVVVIQLAGGLPITVTFPAAVIRATANFITIIVLSPVIWKTFDRMGQLAVRSE